jgi:hypothetical protein
VPGSAAETGAAACRPLARRRRQGATTALRDAEATTRRPQGGGRVPVAEAGLGLKQQPLVHQEGGHAVAEAVQGRISEARGRPQAGNLRLAVCPCLSGQGQAVAVWLQGALPDLLPRPAAGQARPGRGRYLHAGVGG